MSNIRTGTGHTMGWRDTAETLLEALIPDDIETNESPEQILARAEATTQPDVGDAEVFSGAELRKAVLALKRGKCPGLDRIEAEAYKIRRSINFEFEGLAFQENEAATGSRTRSLLRARLREAILRTWQRRWLSSSKGRTTFEFFDDVQTRLRSNWVRLDTYVVQFLSGHGNFRAKLRAFNLVENELCQCGEEQTSGHLLFHCENYTNSRSDLRNKSLEIGLRDTITPRELVSKELFETFKELARKILSRQSNDDGTTQRLETDVQGQSSHLDSTGDQSPNTGTSGRDTSPTNALME
ncbi:hypothetical protein KPH14_000970 [Odynerus spinipes]|uniref:Reverse transcriptase n=1 Tax=Odynerus spinipes TaxID=1348599 RepID=A0AAD9RFP5_9HYME|nr:hypothetical protein KPH14_000970 [Odynerus spinipes]